MRFKTKMSFLAASRRRIGCGAWAIAVGIGWGSSPVEAGTMFSADYRTGGNVRDAINGSRSPISLAGSQGQGLTDGSIIDLAKLTLSPTAGQAAREVSARFGVALTLLNPVDPEIPPYNGPLVATGTITGTIGGTTSSLHVHFDPATTPFGGVWPGIPLVSNYHVVTAWNVGPADSSLLGLLRVDRMDFNINGPSDAPLSFDLAARFEVHPVTEPASLIILAMAFGGYGALRGKVA